MSAPAPKTPLVLSLATFVLLGVAFVVPPQLYFLRYLFVIVSFFWGRSRGSMTSWIVVAMAWGIILGQDFPHHADAFRLPSKIFLKLIKTIVAPLLFSTLVVGIAGHSDLKAVGRMGVKALIYFELVTSLALFVGLGAINFSQAGVGVTQQTSSEAAPLKADKQNLQEIILHTFPENIAKSVAEGDVLQVVVFSILFGVALAVVPHKKGAPMVELVESLAETMFKFTNIVMKLAPLAVGSAIAYTVATMGAGMLAVLLKLLVTLYVALLVFILCVLLPIAYFTGVPLLAFGRAVSEPVSIAFATASSEAALPRAMERLEELGVPRAVVAFVLPTGYSFNLDGTTLYLSLASVFVAQAAGIPMPLSMQIWMMITLLITSKGVAGVPRASLVILLGTAASFGLPEWPILAIMGIDGLMDMARTAVNVTGNCLAAVVVARWEKVFVPNYNSPFYKGYPGATMSAELGLTPEDSPASLPEPGPFLD